jgi:hypothetical protein
VPQPRDYEGTKGSLDAPSTLWLTPESLVKAVVRAGFRIEAYFHELDDSCPDVIKRWGSELGFGHENTKVFLVATPLPGAEAPAREPTQRRVGSAPRTPGRALSRRAAARLAVRRIRRRR